MKRLLILLFITVSPALAADSSATLTREEVAPIPVSTGEVVDVSSITAGPAIRGIHLTASAAGSKRYRQNHLEPMLAKTIINAVVIDIKEEDGWVYIPGIKMVQEAKAYANDIPDLPEFIADMKRRHIYTVGRIVTFKDNKAPRRYPRMAVHNLNGDVWQDRKRIAWLDPYNHEAWRYDFLVALQAARLGFDEIQFDYIRFPTDGNLKSMHFSKPYTPTAATQSLVEFLRQAAQLLHPLGVKVSIDVFGLTTTVNSGMGIGQRLTPMANVVDFVCPMTYPSHYAPGEYGIPIPNNEPYRVIHLAVRDALKALGPAQAHKLRPYYQDFSLKGRGMRYGPSEIRAQIQAAMDLGAPNWTLWNASCKYTTAALTRPFAAAPLPKYLQTGDRKVAKQTLESAVPAASSAPVVRTDSSSVNASK